MFRPGFLTRDMASALNALWNFYQGAVRGDGTIPAPDDSGYGGSFVSEADGDEYQNTAVRVRLEDYDADTGLYSWTQVYADGRPTEANNWFDQTGTPNATDGSVSLTQVPAYEANGNIAPIGTIVQIRRSYYDASGNGYDWVYVFDCPGGSAVVQTVNYFQPEDLVGTTLEITPTPVTITTTPQNNYALPATAWLKVTSSTVNVSLNSIVAPTYDQFQYIENVEASTKNVVITNNGGGTTANQFLTQDGLSISAVWAGELQPGSCGREFRGTWRNSGDDRTQPFVLRKTGP